MKTADQLVTVIPVKFFWVGEETEIYAAESLDQLETWLKENVSKNPKDYGKIKELSDDELNVVQNIKEEGTEVRYKNIVELFNKEHEISTYMPKQLVTSYA